MGHAPIPFLRPSLPPTAAVERHFAESRGSRWFSNAGPCHARLVERLERYLGDRVACVPVSNCTLGLMLALRALAGEGGSGREVIVPSFTFAATAAAIRWCGLEPVFADVDPWSWQLDPESLAAALEQRDGRVAAVLACSTFGVAPPREQSRAWEDLAAGAGVALLVDSAAGFGARDADGRPLGAQGDAEAFSFHATKPFAIGEGGLVCTADRGLAERIRRLANFGFGPQRTVEHETGLNAKLDEWHAATALAVLDSYEDVLAARRSRAGALRDALEPAGLRFQPGGEAGSWQFVPVAAPSPAARDAALAAAAAEAIELRSYFAPPLHAMPAFAACERVGSLPGTERLARTMLSLPMANDLAEGALARIAAVLERAVGRAGGVRVP